MQVTRAMLQAQIDSPGVGNPHGFPSWRVVEVEDTFKPQLVQVLRPAEGRRRRWTEADYSGGYALPETVKLVRVDILPINVPYKFVANTLANNAPLLPISIVPVA